MFVYHTLLILSIILLLVFILVLMGRINLLSKQIDTTADVMKRLDEQG